MAILGTDTFPAIRYITEGDGINLSQVGTDQAVIIAIDDNTRQIIGVTPEMFGAVGDGVSDDTTALLAAVAHCNSTGAGLNFGLGVYNTASTLLQTAPFLIIGQGGGGQQSQRGETAASAKSRIKWIGASGGTIWKMETPASTERRAGGGMMNLMLDGNEGLAAKTLEISCWAFAKFTQVSFYGASQDNVLTRILDTSPPTGPNTTQYITFERCFAGSKDGGLSAHGDNTATGWRLTGGQNAQQGNTCFVTLKQCHVLNSKGTPYYIENTDNITIDSCSGEATFGTTENVVFCSSDEDTGGLAEPARFNRIINSQLSVRLKASQTGGSSTYSHTIIGLSRSNGTPLPVFETPAGGASAPTALVIDGGEGDEDIPARININGDQIISNRLSEWEMPVGPGDRSTFDVDTVTLPELAGKFKRLLKDLGQYHHGLIGLTDGGIDDCDIVAAEEASVCAISFLDDTMRIRDVATPANDYTGTATGKLTVTGTLTASANGAAFDASNYATIALSALPWLNATGTIMVEYEMDSFTSAVNATLLSVDAGINGLRHTIRAISTSSDRPQVVGVNTSTQYSLTDGAWGYTAGTIRRVAVTFQADDVRSVSKQRLSVSDSAATMPSVTTLRIGVNHSNAEPANCNIRRVFMTNRVFNDRELLELDLIAL